MNEVIANYLEENWKAHCAILSAKQQLEVIRDRIDTVRLVKSSIHRGDTTDLIADLCEQEKALLQEIKKSLAIHEERKACISTVQNPTYRTLLELRYLAFLSWDDICEQMFYSKRYIFKLRDRALDSISDEAIAEAKERQRAISFMESHACTVENKAEKV